MDNWQRNQEVINNGRGSEQERSHNRNCDCSICNPEALTCPNCGEITKDGELCLECETNETLGDKYGRS